MSQTTYSVFMSTDGKHTVSVATDDPVKAKESFGWVKATYDRLVQIYGTKADLYQKANGSRTKGAEAPTCAVHHVPMAKVEGKAGPFWSCHQKNPDGSWCSVKPKGE